MKVLPGLGVAVVALAALLLAACGGGSTAYPTLTAAPAAASEAAEAAPDFEIALFQSASHTAGETLRLSDLKGKAVVVNFWYPSCPPCRVEMPDFEAAFQKYKGQDVEFIAIQALGLDTVQNGQDFVTEFGLSYAIGPDTDSSILVDYEVSGFPSTVFLDKEHRVVRHWTGALNAAKLDELVQEALNAPS